MRKKHRSAIGAKDKWQREKRISFSSCRVEQECLCVHRTESATKKEEKEMNNNMNELLEAVKNLREVIQKLNAEQPTVSSVNIFSYGGTSIHLVDEQNILDISQVKSLGATSCEINVDDITIRATL